MEDGQHDCVGQIQKYMRENGSLNEQLENKLKEREEQLALVKQNYETMAKKNKNVVLRLQQQLDQAIKENKSLHHDLNSIPDGIDHKKVQ